MKRYGHAPKDELSLCNRPDSCIHIAKECPAHDGYILIGHHSAACQLVHAAIRKSTNDGGALHSTLDIILVAADAETQPQTTTEMLASRRSTQMDDNDPNLEGPNDPEDWLTPSFPTESTRRKKHADVSQDFRYTK
jgi:hypothetical protein